LRGIASRLEQEKKREGGRRSLAKDPKSWSRKQDLQQSFDEIQSLCDMGEGDWLRGLREELTSMSSTVFLPIGQGLRSSPTLETASET
jgi:hypothetical protein